LSIAVNYIKPSQDTTISPTQRFEHPPARGDKQNNVRSLPGFIFVIDFLRSRMRTWGRGRETGVSRGGNTKTEWFQGVNPIHDWFAILLAETTPFKHLILGVFWFIGT